MLPLYLSRQLIGSYLLSLDELYLRLDEQSSDPSGTCYHIGYMCH
jgi:hypothetical protein